MTLTDCIFEAELAGGVHLWDASHLMPRYEPKRKQRQEIGIDRLFFHHSGALGRAGLAGALASARYVVRKRRFPGPAYTFWLPAEDLRDKSGALCVLRLNDDAERSWHTGSAKGEVSANVRGVAACFQGNTTSKPLTRSHMECAEALIPWCVNRYGLTLPDGLSFHAEASTSGGRDKKACPGKHGEAWVRRYRQLNTSRIG